jgi:SRSO17 transposase
LVTAVGARLQRFWQRYAPLFRTQTRDGRPYAYHYLSGLVRLLHERTFVNIGRQAGVAGRNVQHFISTSPWSAGAVIARVQEEIRATPGPERGGMLLLDESADCKAGTVTAGAGRQRNGRLGSVQLSQVGTFLAYVHVEAGVWTWVDGELFIPQDWFTPQRGAHRTRVGVPAERAFETKLDLGWRMIQRASVPYEAVACDTLYGRSVWLWRQLAAAGMIYSAEVPAHTQVYLDKPVVGLPPGHLRARKLRVLEGWPLTEYRLRIALRQRGETLAGLNPAARSQTTERPTTERVLAAFQHITRTAVTLAKQVHHHVTSLTPLQGRVLALLHLPPDLDARLAAPAPQPLAHLRE